MCMTLTSFIQKTKQNKEKNFLGGYHKQEGLQLFLLMLPIPMGMT